MKGFLQVTAGLLVIIAGIIAIAYFSGWAFHLGWNQVQP